MQLVPSRLRPWWGLAAGLVLVGLATLVSLPIQDHGTRAAPALLLVVAPLVAALVGGRAPALVVAGVGALSFASVFLPPLGSPRVRTGEDFVALVVFLGVALFVGSLVGAVVSAEHKRVVADEARIAGLEELNRQRSAFLRGVSHDLRTPLATIRAAASELDSEPRAAREMELRMLSLVIDEADRLDRMVGNLLSLNRAESGLLQLDLKATDLAELVTTCVARHHRLVRDTQVSVHVPADVVLVDADAVQLDQVVTNLIENAVRHSPADGLVRVEVAQSADAVTLTVTDDGPGVPAAVRENLFQPFAPGPGSTSTGAGLATCRAIVDAHGGTIALDDGFRQGARFVVSLPLHRADDLADRG